MNKIGSDKLFLSIVTICKNNLEGLRKTLESVRNQTNKQFEFLVIDGNSNDGTREYIEKNNTYITKFISEPDFGIYDAQNKGIKIASGEYILFLNSGDVLLNDSTLEELLSHIKNHVVKKIGIYYSDVFLKKENQLYKKTYKKILSAFYLSNEIINHQSQIIQTKILQKNLFDLKYKLASDYELFLRLVFKNKINYMHLDMVISIYDLSGVSTTMSGIETYQSEHSEIRKIYFPDEVSRVLDLQFYQDSVQLTNALESDKILKLINKKLYSVLEKYPLIDRFTLRFFTFLLKIKSIFKWQSS
jgi:glycosyltransferase involved in cell wall biosynthesis